MKIFLLLLCILTLAIVAQEPQQKNLAAAPSSEIFLLGVLSKTQPLALKCPSEYCLEDGYLYASTAYIIGDINFHYEFKRDLSPLVGKVVLARGKMERGLDRIVRKGEKAPANYGQEQSMMQMRDDWVREETGFQIGHSTHEKLAKVSYFHATEIEEYKGLSIQKDKKGLSITFQNTLDFPLTLTLSGHYESTRGKPQPHYKSQEITLEPGQSTTQKFSYGLQHAKKHYRLSSIILEGSSDKIQIVLRRSAHAVEKGSE